MDSDERRTKVEAFFERPDPALIGSLDAALYAVSELGLWPDAVDSMSVEHAMKVWKIVERMRTTKFPAELRM